jgi:Ca-activated chloride channel family protein
VTLAHPWFLLLLLLLPLAAWLKGKRGRPPAFIYSSVQPLRAMLNVTRSRSGGFLAALRWLTLAILTVALAQPQLTSSETKVTASGIDIVAAIDLSGSMNAPDFELHGQVVNRLTMAKEVLKNFIGKRPNDRIGLVAFGREAFIAAPLTLDHDFLMQNLDRIELGLIDYRMTAIGDGLSTAINRLRELKSKSKIVILMTDGENNAGKLEPLTVAEAARALGIKVYTIGVGRHGAPGGPDSDVIDEATLQKIADMTGGIYYAADNAKKFQEIYDEIDRLEKSEVEVKKYSHVRELFRWFIAPALGLVLVEVVLRNTLLRRIP